MIYPEYLTDPNILFCPSDSDLDPTEFVDSNGNPILHRRPERVDQSYAYIGWAFDRIEANKGGCGPITGYPLLSVIVSLLGGAIPTGAQAPLQLAAGVDRLAENILNMGGVTAYTSTNPSAAGTLIKIADMDLDVSNRGTGADGALLGNGGGPTIYRLREGIERFLITDINNPAASAQAQSELVVMFDQIGTGAGVALMNHVPGGLNVLYMDGHVRFVRYVPGPGGESPATDCLAQIVGLIAGEV
jgi:prepilin-type processing-associated H-X9-DG protein